MARRTENDELIEIRQCLAGKDSELELLRSLVHVMREDLNVKNEQVG